MKLIATSILYFFPLVTFGQYNLVPNRSFEETINCPSMEGQLFLAQSWLNPNAGSPDYYNVCAIPYITPLDTTYIVNIPENVFGYQEAKTGNAYAGFYNYSAFPSREHVEIKLNEKLIRDKKYVFSCYLSLADKFGFGSRVDALFSDTLISYPDSTNLNWFIPQLVTPYSILDKENWVLWQDTVTSVEGGEEYLIIGNFLDVESSDTVYSGSGEGSYNFKSYYYIDDVSLIPLDSLSGVEEYDRVRFELYPNPNSGSFTINLKEALIDNGTIEILDLQGRAVFAQNIPKSQKNLEVRTSNLSQGVYFLKVETAVFSSSQKIIIR
jgi:hypothetical protein